VNHRPMFRILASAPVLLLFAFAPASAPAAAPPSTPAPAEQPRFEPDTSAIEADEYLQWAVPLRIRNNFAVGIYLDSLICEVQDLDPGETRAERSTVLDVSAVVKGSSVSAGDDFALQYLGPAIAEHAKLTFQLALHRADGSRTTLTTAVEAMPGALSRDHPSQFLTVDGRRVEYVLFPAGRDSAPAVLLVHGNGSHARQMLLDARRLVVRGYAVMLVSMPGFGQSEGPADFVGPATVRALSAALDRLTAWRGADPKRIAAWGIARGAAAVTLLAQRRSDLRAAVAESGIYDLWAVYRATTVPAYRDTIVSQAGSDSSAWRARSAALNPAKPAAILILHGELDAGVPAQQARGFAESLKARGAEVETRFFPNSGQPLQRGHVMNTAYEFLKRRLGG